MYRHAIKYFDLSFFLSKLCGYHRSTSQVSDCDTVKLINSSLEESLCILTDYFRQHQITEDQINI